MGDFFHGWRRKVGCTTLVVAIVFAAVWIRSESTCDWIEFEIKHPPKFGRTYSYTWMSARGMAIRLSFEPVLAFGKPPILGKWRVTPVSQMQKLPLLKWQFRAVGCGLGEIEGSEKEIGGSFWAIQYWPLTLVLTLLSAYLLLSKPRSGKAASIEPQSPPSSQP